MLVGSVTASNQLKMANMLGCRSHEYFMLCKISSQESREGDSSAGLEEAATLGTACGEGRVAGTCGRPPRTEGSLQLIASDTLRTSVLQP